MKISVCIPVYGVEKYMERCARSLFEQTMQEDIEFIFVDDCTPDKSMEVLQNVLQQYPQRKDQVKIVRHERNQGLTGARNSALQHAAGDYIIHCDSDDWVDSGLYEALYLQAVATQADMVHCAIKIESGSRVMLRRMSGGDIDTLFFKHFNTVEFNSLVNKLFVRRVAVAPETIAPSHITMAEDLLRTTQMLLKCAVVSECSGGFYHYRCDNPTASTTSFGRKEFESAREVMNILIKAFPAKYQTIAESCKGQLLFSALRVPEISNGEIAGMFDLRTRIRSVFNPHLALGKRGLLACSLFSIALARWSCRFLIKIAGRTRIR